MDYLFRQTGSVLQNVQPDSEETNQMLEDVGDEAELEDEGFEDAGVDPTIPLLDIQGLSSSFSAPTSIQTSASTSTSASPAAVCSGSSTIPTSSVEVLPAPTGPPATVPLSTVLDAPPPPPPPPPMISGPPLQRQPINITTASATLSTAVSTSAGAVPSATAAEALAAPEQQLAVDERNIPGMDRVDSLAEYLAGLRAESGHIINNQQASTIIALWQNLLPYDQQRIAYAARHQVRLTTGRYKQPKLKAEFTPGVESMARSVCGSAGSPAQWPDCCRLVESIFVKLANIHKSPKKQGTHSLTRWTLILRDYHRIRQLILGNGAVMQSTTLQLFEVNQTTLIQWHNKRLKRQDGTILLQGVNLPPTISVAPVPLPPPQTRPPTAPPQSGPHHQYHLPINTAGQAVLKRRSNAPPGTDAGPPVRPKVQGQRQLFPRVAPPTTSAPVPVLNPTLFTGPHMIVAPPVSRVHIAPAGPPPVPAAPARRAYHRTVDKNKCRRCGQPKGKETGHGQFYGHVYCPQNTAVSLEQWMEKMRRKRAGRECK